MAPATEIALLNIQADATLEDPSSPKGKVWQEMLGVVAKQKGFQRSYWGRKVEEPNVLVWVIDWDSVEDHHAFMNSAEYRPFFELASPVLDLSNPPILNHTHYNEPVSKVITAAPATEMATFMIPSSASEAEKSELEDAVIKLVDVCQSDPENGTKAKGFGWIVEDIEHDKSPTGKAAGLAIVLAWPSVPAHMAVRETKAFAEAIAPVRAKMLSGLPGRAMCHIKFQAA